VSRQLVALAGFAALLALAACGGEVPAADANKPSLPPPTRFESRPAHQILQTSVAAMHDLDSYRMLWRTSKEDKILTFDFRVDDKRQCTGLMTIGGSARAQVVITKDATYQKGNANYWRQDAPKDDASFVAAARGRWVKSPRISQLAALCTIDTFVGELDRLQAVDDDDLTVSPVTLLGGIEIVSVTSSADSVTGKIVIEIASPHHVQSIVEGSNTFIFSEFDAPVEINVPSPGEYVDITELFAR
jgi:hypothetical protein